MKKTNKEKMTFAGYVTLVSYKNDEIRALKERVKQLEDINKDLSEQLEDVKRQL